MMCAICSRNECAEFWTVCASCYEGHLQCLRTEDRIRRQMLREIDRCLPTTKTTPGMQGRGASVHERRGRKLLRPVRQEVFIYDEDGNELE